MVGTRRVWGWAKPGQRHGAPAEPSPFALKGYHLRISDPDIGYLGLAREFECFSKFEVCKHHAIIHDACGAARNIYNVGPRYWYGYSPSFAHANYPEGNLSCLKSSPFIGHITGLSWCWKNRNELNDIFGKV